jgi:hypothetical protein
LLARVRTDLDAFSDVEACSQMTDGYAMSSANLPRERGSAGVAGIVRERPLAREWPFLCVAGALRGSAGEPFRRRLEVPQAAR